jgi:hypothetical protein
MLVQIDQDNGNIISSILGDSLQSGAKALGFSLLALSSLLLLSSI